nr:small multicopy peptide B [Limnephilus flavicornis]
MQFRILFLVCLMLASALMASASPTLKALPCLLGRVKGILPVVKGYPGSGGCQPKIIKKRC